MIWLILAAALLILLKVFLPGGAMSSYNWSDYSPAIQAFAQAIAVAEGFGPAGNLATICNNPGDLTKGDYGDTGLYRTDAAGNQNIVFPTAAAGWGALAHKLSVIAAGTSPLYKPAMTFLDMSQVYSGSTSGDWGRNVANELGALVTDQIGAYLL